MKDYIDSVISGSNSMIRGKNESYDQRMRDLDRQIEKLYETASASGGILH